MAFVGVDGGTGDMEAVVMDRHGRVLGRGHGGPSNNPAVVGRMHPRVGRHLVGAIGAAVEQAGISRQEVEALSLNLSGDPDQLTRENARAWVAPLGLRADCVLAIEDDGLSAWAAGGFPDPCIWVLLGTNCGSAGMLGGKKVEHPLGSLDLDAHYGAALGGARIGTAGLSLAVHSQLGGAPTRLFDAYRQQLGVSDLDGLIAWAREHTTSDERAELLRAVSEAAGAGDGPASELLERSGRRIARTTVAFGCYLGLMDRPVTILLTGKAWRAGEWLLRSFERTVRSELPHAEIRINRLSQSQGAALLAMKQAGLELGPEIYAAAEWKD